MVRPDGVMPRARWSPSDYNRLEAAITSGARVALVRRSGGSELVLVPRRLGFRAGHEMIEAVHPATGELLTIMLDDVDRFEVMS